MASLTFDNAFFEVNGTDLSTETNELTWNKRAETLDRTVFGNASRVHKGGLEDGSVDVTFVQNYAAGKVDATFFPIAGTTACFEWRPQNICTTACNPSFSGVFLVESYEQGGPVGSLIPASVRLVSASTMDRSVAAS